MKLWPFGKKDYDLNGNRFYQEYIINREITASQRYLKVAASLAAGLRIAEGVAAMPIITGNKSYDANGRLIQMPTMDGDLYERLTVAPNDYMTAGEFIETLTLHAVFEGVGRAYIDRGYKGKIRRLIPIVDGGINLQRDVETGKVFYNGTITGIGTITNATRKDFIEITSPRWMDTEGLDISSEIKKVLGLSITLEDRQAEDGIKKSIPGYITTEQQLSGEAATKILDAIKGKLAGTPIFDSGAGYKSIVPTQAEMQLMETRRFLIEEVARAYGIHPIFLAHDAAGQSLTRVSDAMDYHITITLSPWLRRWEQAIQFSLLKADEFVNLDETQYYRGDLTTKAEYAAKALGNNTGWETQNDVRSRMGMNPVVGGDFIPSSTTKEANNAA